MMVFIWSLSRSLRDVSASHAGSLCSWTCVCSEVFLCFAAGLRKMKRAMNTSVEKMQSHMGWSEHVDSRKPWKWKPDKWFERKEGFFLIHNVRLLLAGPGLLPVLRLKNITADYACQSQPLHDTLPAWHFTDHSTSPTLSALSHPQHAVNVSNKTWQQRALSKMSTLLFKD